MKVELDLVKFSPSGGWGILPCLSLGAGREADAGDTRLLRTGASSL